MSGQHAATQILSFDNFGALETHLRALKARYGDMIKKYEETLGHILRDVRPLSAKGQKVQEKWTLDMQQALANSKAGPKGKIAVAGAAAKKEEKPKMTFGSGGKDKNQQDGSGEWVMLDPMSIFVGQKIRGMAEIYFDTINVLRESVSKVNQALSICSALKAKAAASGSASLVVAFVNDIPVKVMVKPVDEGVAKKYAMTFSFTVPSVQQAA